MSLTPDWGRLFHRNQLRFKEKSIGDASTFTGFCSYHDSKIFSELDRDDFDGSARLSVLSAYRTLCRELFMKKGFLSAVEKAKDFDRGSTPAEQVSAQESLTHAAYGAESAFSELSDILPMFEGALRASDYSCFAYRNFAFPDEPNLVSAGGFNPSHTLNGVHLQNLDASSHSQNVFLSVLPGKTGFWASFVWPCNYRLIEKFVKEVEENYATVGGVSAVALANIENTFLRPSFWRRLSLVQKEQFRLLVMMDVTHQDYVGTGQAAQSLKKQYSTPASVVMRSN